MSWIVHLSDLHLLGDGPAEQDVILRSLVSALRDERERRGRPADLICVTGDVFDTAIAPVDQAVSAFSHLLDAMHRALGGDIPTVVIPGNHDRRRAGLFLPYVTDLFDALRRALVGRAWVLGGERPFLSEVVPHEVHGLPLWVVAYDSNHLPDGLIGAGGAMRQEDMLRAASIIDGHHPDWPVLFLLHHHLVPTPLTDLGPIETQGFSTPVRWLVDHALPELMAHADREEMFVTALGAGTALATLGSMNRAVLVLHGHKHYATARLLAATQASHGDVLVVSAGSAGCAQRWHPGRDREAARLWPSFNAIELEPGHVDVEQVAYGWRAVSHEVARRPMVRARRAGPRWTPTPLEDDAAIEPGPRLEVNACEVRLTPGSVHPGSRWDHHVRRTVRFVDPDDGPYVETVDSPPGSELVLGRGARRTRGDGPIALASGESRYTLQGGGARTMAEERRVAGRHATPYGRIVLLNRYQCADAGLSVEGLGERASTAFGSATDLGTGLERAVPVTVDDGRVTVAVRDCPPRTLLRLYWLLEDGALPEGVGRVPLSASFGFVDAAEE